MKHKFFRLLALCLTLAILAGLFPAPVQALEIPQNNPYWDSVTQQVRAYANSINFSDADTEAAWALAGHGISGRGSKLSVGADHPLTATLLNSELGTNIMFLGIARAIDLMAQSDREYLYLNCGLQWSSQKLCGSTVIYESEDDAYDNFLYSSGVVELSETPNSYDSSLVWMVGTVNSHQYITRSRATADSVTYHIKITFDDRFDFSTGTGSIPKDFLSLIGSFLFQEFNWSASVEFDVTAPNYCTHQPNTLHITYDPASTQLLFDDAQGLAQMTYTKIHQTYAAANSFFFRLDRPIRLTHDRPWVLEYTATNNSKICLAEATPLYTAKPCFVNNGYLFVSRAETDPDGTKFLAYYGAYFRYLFPYSPADIYTFRLENQPASNGANTIYLTVYNNTTQECVLDHFPMDDYYRTIDGTSTLIDDQSTALQGLDFTINYLGNSVYGFDPSYFDLWVWENGDVPAHYTHCEVISTTAPTCASQGFTRYRCNRCGYIFDSDYTDALPHTWGPWKTMRNPTYETEGKETRFCSVCGGSESRAIPRLEYTPGDVNEDTVINIRDLILIRQYLAGWDVTLVLGSADTNGDGSVNVKDLILLRQYLAGWDVILK